MPNGSASLQSMSNQGINKIQQLAPKDLTASRGKQTRKVIIKTHGENCHDRNDAIRLPDLWKSGRNPGGGNTWAASSWKAVKIYEK